MITDSEIEAALKLCEAATPISSCKYCGNQNLDENKELIAARTLLSKALEEVKRLRVELNSDIPRQYWFDQSKELEKLRAENERLRLLLKENECSTRF